MPRRKQTAPRDESAAGAFIDWPRIFSYDALLTMVAGARGRGKTFGLRRQFVADWLNSGFRFVEVCRYKSQLSDVSAGYFDALIRKGLFPGHIFKTEGGRAYIAEKPADDEKPKWQLFGYFVALSDYQNIKKRTFANVKRIVLDEAIIERMDAHHRYLKQEWAILQSVCDSVLREEPGENRGRVYLLANACDLVNPYFVALGVDRAPAYGFTKYNGGRFLLYYEEPGDYAEAKREGTLAGVMGDFAGDTAVSVYNRFAGANEDFIEEKPANAKFEFGISYLSQQYGIWSDFSRGFYYVNKKIPANTNRPVYALTARDNRANVVVAKRAEKTLMIFAELFYAGIVKYDSPGTRETFVQVLSLFGVR